jgi:hypothetical protein
MSTVNNGPQIVRNGLVLDLDASYMRSYSPNVYPNPTDLLGWQYMGTQLQSCSVTRDTTITRQYGSIPMKMSITGNDPFAGAYNSSIGILAPALSGQTWTISVWAKATVATDGQLFIFGADTNGAVFVSPDYNAGNMSITTSWQRFSFSYTFTNANTRYIQFRLDGTNTGGSGITIWWDGLQIERASSATTFNPYYFGNTVWRDISGNNNNGTLYNSPTFNGSNGGNMVFNGTNNYLQANINSNILDGDPNFSVEFFVKRTADFVSSGFWGIGGAGQGYSIEGWTPTTNEIHLDLYDSTRLSSGVTYPLNTWVHVVWTKSGSAISTSTTKLYVNSNLTTLTLTRAQTTGPRYNTSTAGVGISLGRPNGDSNSNYAPITIGLFRIYSRQLSATEASQNYQATKTRFGL